MAQRIVDLVIKEFPKKEKRAFKKCQTKNISLTANPLANAKAVESYIKDLQKRVIALGLNPYYGWYLATVYGKQAETILTKMDDFKDNQPAIALARAEAWFGVHHEMVNRADDFFVRRTGRLYFDIGSIASIREAVLADLQTYLGWDANRLAKEIDYLDELIYDATHYYEAELMANGSKEAVIYA